MSKTTLKTQCRICAASSTGMGITRHLGTHLTQLQAANPTKPTSVCHIKVKADDYFLHLLVSSELTFKKLDDFLRDTWLECCGHMSQFMINGWDDEIANSKKIGAVLAINNKISYAYDFGSTTVLEISLKGTYNIALSAKQKANVTILARNEAPTFTCTVCQKTADYICTECCDTIDNPFYCEDCVSNEDKHECGEDYSLCICNSPRMGVCAYEGEDEEELVLVKLG